MKNLNYSQLLELSPEELSKLVVECENGRYENKNDFDYYVRSYPSNLTVSLQGVGHVIGKPTSEFKQGERMMWNNGETSMYYGIAKETAKFYEVIEIYNSFKDVPEVGTRRMKKDRLVGCYGKDLSLESLEAIEIRKKQIENETSSERTKRICEEMRF